MEKISILDFIKGLPFFEHFSEDEKSCLINSKGLFEKYSAGEIIIKQGAIESWLFIILQGKIKLSKEVNNNIDKSRISLTDSEEIVVKELDIGSIFGEISLITDRPRNVTARASSNEVAVLKITKEILESFDKSIQMKFQKQLLTKLAENLDDMNTEFIKLKAVIKKGLKK